MRGLVTPTALATVLGLMAALGARPVEGAGDPSVRWRTIETAHFRIHFEERYRELAERLAELAEETHEQLVPIFGLTIEPPLDVLVEGEVDTANGSARSIPYNLIRVFAFAPEADSTLGDSDDWLRLLFLHEYIHILHINEISGISAVVNAVLGKTWAFNQALPRWYIEGLATFGESAFTEGGRLRNNAFRMYLRMDALADNFRRPGDLGGFPYEWPGATGWYLYGSDFVDYVARTYGLAGWLEFNERVGGGLAPLAVNEYARQIFGATIVDLWEEYAAAAQGEFQAEAVGVVARGRTRVRNLTEGGNLSGYPRCRTPYSVGYVRDDGRTPREIAVTDLVANEREGWLDVFGSGTFDWFPNGQALAFTQGTNHEIFYRYNEIFIYDRRTETRRQLTFGERAREPAVSPDGRHVAYVAAIANGGVELREVDVFSGEVRTLVGAPDGELSSMPDYAPDGRGIVFSQGHIDWGRDLFLYDRDSGAVERLTHDRAQDLEPSFTPDGRRVLFASDRTGIYNAYALELGSGEVRQLTNVFGGVFSPRQCVSDGPLYVRTYGPWGFDVGEVAEPVDWPAPEPYERPEVDYPQRGAEDVIVRETRYRAAPTLLPRDWSPVISDDGDSVLFGAEVVGADAAFHHVYAASVNYGLDSEHLDVAGSYSYRRLPANIFIFAARTENTIRNELRIESRLVPFEEERIQAGVTVSFPFQLVDARHTLSANWTFNHTRALSIPEAQHDPADLEPIPPETGRFDSVRVGWSWSDTRGFRYSIGAESGTGLSTNIVVRAPITGADFSSVALSWSVRHYQANPWLPGQYFAFLYSGAIGRASFSQRPLFAVGGFPDQQILQAVLDQTPIGAGFLRGYEPFAQVGEQFHLLNAEYRIPLWEPDVGAWTLPVFIERFYLAAFADYGTAVDELDGFKSFLLGVGAEIRMQAWLGFTVPADFRLGYARGLSGDGIHDFYVLYGGTF